jgi:hypothetical protein
MEKDDLLSIQKIDSSKKEPQHEIPKDEHISSRRSQLWRLRLLRVRTLRYVKKMNDRANPKNEFNL